MSDDEDNFNDLGSDRLADEYRESPDSSSSDFDGLLFKISDSMRPSAPKLSESDRFLIYDRIILELRKLNRDPELIQNLPTDAILLCLKFASTHIETDLHISPHLVELFTILFPFNQTHIFASFSIDDQLVNPYVYHRKTLVQHLISENHHNVFVSAVLDLIHHNKSHPTQNVISRIFYLLKPINTILFVEKPTIFQQFHTLVDSLTEFVTDIHTIPDDSFLKISHISKLLFIWERFVRLVTNRRDASNQAELTIFHLALNMIGHSQIDAVHIGINLLFPFFVAIETHFIPDPEQKGYPIRTKPFVGVDIDEFRDDSDESSFVSVFAVPDLNDVQSLLPSSEFIKELDIQLEAISPNCSPDDQNRISQMRLILATHFRLDTNPLDATFVTKAEAEELIPYGALRGENPQEFPDVVYSQGSSFNTFTQRTHFSSNFGTKDQDWDITQPANASTLIEQNTSLEWELEETKTKVHALEDQVDQLTEKNKQMSKETKELRRMYAFERGDDASDDSAETEESDQPTELTEDDNVFTSLWLNLNRVLQSPIDGSDDSQEDSPKNPTIPKPFINSELGLDEITEEIQLGSLLIDEWKRTGDVKLRFDIRRKKRSAKPRPESPKNDENDPSTATISIKQHSRLMKSMERRYRKGYLQMKHETENAKSALEDLLSLFVSTEKCLSHLQKENEILEMKRIEAEREAREAKERILEIEKESQVNAMEATRQRRKEWEAEQESQITPNTTPVHPHPADSDDLDENSDDLDNHISMLEKQVQSVVDQYGDSGNKSPTASRMDEQTQTEREEEREEEREQERRNGRKEGMNNTMNSILNLKEAKQRWEEEKRAEDEIRRLERQKREEERLNEQKQQLDHFWTLELHKTAQNEKMKFQHEKEELIRAMNKQQETQHNEMNEFEKQLELFRTKYGKQKERTKRQKQRVSEQKEKNRKNEDIFRTQIDELVAKNGEMEKTNETLREEIATLQNSLKDQIRRRMSIERELEQERDREHDSLAQTVHSQHKPTILKTSPITSRQIRDHTLSEEDQARVDTLRRMAERLNTPTRSARQTNQSLEKQEVWDEPQSIRSTRYHTPTLQSDLDREKEKSRLLAEQNEFVMRQLGEERKKWNDERITHIRTTVANQKLQTELARIGTEMRRQMVVNSPQRGEMFVTPRTREIVTPENSPNSVRRRQNRP